MNKTLYILSLIVVITLTSCQNSLTADRSVARDVQPETNTAVTAMHLPANIAVPETLPTTVQDPVLLEGWIRLYNSRQNCGTWDGNTLTGQKLAQYVIDHHVVITWNTSTMYIGSWVDRDQTKTIYINPVFKEEPGRKMIHLVGEIAHEIFHDLTPFKQKADTLYEEFFAFYVGTCVSGMSTQNFENINPLSSDSLTLWFRINKPTCYLDDFEMYPKEMVAIYLP